MATKGEINRIGERLRVDEPRAGDDLVLQEFLDAHGSALEGLVASLRTVVLRDGSFLVPTSRVKTMGTLVEKLQRDRFNLAEVRDIAGARVTVSGSLAMQDEVRDLILARFEGSRAIDRRVDPRSGYRAIHIALKCEGCWAEIQIRTPLQHRWAETYERLADRVGRKIRYGEVPAPDTIAAQAVESMMSVSASIAVIEEAELQFEDMRKELVTLRRNVESGSNGLGEDDAQEFSRFEARLDALRLKIESGKSRLHDFLESVIMALQ